MGKSYKLYIKTGIFTLVQIVITSLIPYFIYRSFGLSGESIFNLIAAQVFVQTISAFVPLPGASGGAEGGFYAFFRMFFQATTLPALLIWRFITYYANIIFGFVFYYVGRKRYYKEDPPAEAVVQE